MAGSSLESYYVFKVSHPLCRIAMDSIISGISPKQEKCPIFRTTTEPLWYLLRSVFRYQDFLVLEKIRLNFLINLIKALLNHLFKDVSAQSHSFSRSHS